MDRTKYDHRPIDIDNRCEPLTFECKDNAYEYEPIDTDRKYELIEQKFIRHKSNRVKPSKVKTKQRAGTKFMWHKQN